MMYPTPIPSGVRSGVDAAPARPAIRRRGAAAVEFAFVAGIFFSPFFATQAFVSPARVRTLSFGSSLPTGCSTVPRPTLSCAPEPAVYWGSSSVGSTGGVSESADDSL